MKLSGRIIWLILLGAMAFASFKTDNPQVLLRTEMGDILLEIFEKQAPITASNFLRCVDEGRFEGAIFYRVVRPDNQPNNDIKIEVIQGGLGRNDEQRGLPPIPHESTDKTGVLHLEGTLSMARSAPGTASSEFFICIGNQKELDFGGRRNPDGQGFAAFGRVIQGMDVVRKIQQQPAKEQMLVPEIKILSISRIKK
jgi:peptidyl-prolyl cis-trans isomerase A (cyclophilin A)